MTEELVLSRMVKVLVYDDTPLHRNAAKAQLGHICDLTVVGTYDEAQKLLTPKCDWEKQRAFLKEELGEDLLSIERNDRARYRAAVARAKEKATTYPTFDVVLTDLLVLASSDKQGPSGRKYVGQEMPIGIFIGLLASLRGRAKYVAVFTDSNHHDHPASACFDEFNANGVTKPTIFDVGSSKFLLSNTENWVEYYAPGDLSTSLSYDEYKDRKDAIKAKNWLALLDYLTGTEQK